jgi:hypothetical protein
MFGTLRRQAERHGGVVHPTVRHGVARVGSGRVIHPGNGNQLPA